MTRLCSACGRLRQRLTDVGVGADIRLVCDDCLKDLGGISCWRCKRLIEAKDAEEVPTEKHLRKVCKPCRVEMMGS